MPEEPEDVESSPETVDPTSEPDEDDAPSDPPSRPPTLDAIDAAGFETLLTYLAESRGFDFTGYKRPSLLRRVRHRMRAVNIVSFDAYQDYLQANPDEFVSLFNTILINVTSFFRDGESWDYLATKVLPGVLEKADHEVRVWSAGCAGGQEAYSLAILLVEAMGLEQFRERVKIYATDVDEEALAYARQATYNEREMRSVPPEYHQRYFETNGHGMVFRQDLRRSVIFGRNDLTRDAPISRIDLLTCRNTLMYLNAETQARVLSRLGFALKPSGVLFLGKAEMLLNHADTFLPLDLKRRFFRRGALAAVDPQLVSRLPASISRGVPADEMAALRTDAFLASPVAQIVVDSQGVLALANASARQLAGLNDSDIGRRFQDLEVSFRPVELRSSLESARDSRSVRSIQEVPWRRSATVSLFVDIELVPLFDARGRHQGTLLVFTDVTRYRQIHHELEQTTKQLQAASEELQSTNEELETTNEELQSTVEELETTNEELQSTNEELETMNEELQSMNDELQSANDELRERSSEVASLNDFMESILGSMGSAVVVVDRNLLVQVWNRNAQELWGVRSDEAVGTHFLNLDIGLPVDNLKPLLRAVLADPEARGDVHLQAINRRGRSIELTVSVAPLLALAGTPAGGLMMMQEIPAPG